MKQNTFFDGNDKLYFKCDYECVFVFGDLLKYDNYSEGNIT